MRSLEKSHRSIDIDQVDPEHTKRLASEFSYDDLKQVPFNDNRQQPSENTSNTVNSLKNLVDSLSPNEEAVQSERIEEARQRVKDVFRQMDSVSSFGKNARSGNKLSAKEEFNKRLRDAAKESISSQDKIDTNNTF